LPETVLTAALGDRIEFVPGNFFESVPEATLPPGSASTTPGFREDTGWDHAIRAAAPQHAAADQRSVIRPGNDADGASGSTC
jgi:uncharacterized protein with LGFP repeats